MESTALPATFGSIAPVPFPSSANADVRYTPEMLAYCRYRYAVKAQTSEEYREKVRQWGAAARARKKERDAAAGIAPKKVGRPRKYQPVDA